jgi:hypothetical protein
LGYFHTFGSVLWISKILAACVRLAEAVVEDASLHSAAEISVVETAVAVVDSGAAGSDFEAVSVTSVDDDVAVVVADAVDSKLFSQQH